MNIDKNLFTPLSPAPLGTNFGSYKSKTWSTCEKDIFFVLFNFISKAAFHPDIVDGVGFFAVRVEPDEQES